MLSIPKLVPSIPKLVPKISHRECLTRDCIIIDPKDPFLVYEHDSLLVHLFGYQTEPTTFTTCCFYVFAPKNDTNKQYVFFKLEREPTGSRGHGLNAARRYGMKKLAKHAPRFANMITDTFTHGGKINADKRDSKDTLFAPTFREDENSNNQTLVSYRWNDSTLTFEKTLRHSVYTLLQRHGSFDLPIKANEVSWFVYFLRHMTFLHLYDTNESVNDKIKWNIGPCIHTHMCEGPVKGTWIFEADKDSTFVKFLKDGRRTEQTLQGGTTQGVEDETDEDIKFYNMFVRTGNEIFVPRSVHIMHMFQTFMSQLEIPVTRNRRPHLP